jgi:AAA family ATP:ADP antiporter
MVFSNWVNQRTAGQSRETNRGADAEKPLGRQGAFKLIAGQPYLLLIAALMVGSNVVNTTGEFLLGQKVTEEAHRIAVADSAQATAPGSMQRLNQKKMRDFIARFYGNFFFTVSPHRLWRSSSVSRIIKFCGLGFPLLPIIALKLLVVALSPSWRPFILPVVENSTDYSLKTRARALFLPDSREVKYKAKAAIDTFFVRMGDLLSMGLVFLSVQLSLSATTLSSVNVLLALIWLLVVFGIGRRYRILVAVAEGKS